MRTALALLVSFCILGGDGFAANAPAKKPARKPAVWKDAPPSAFSPRPTMADGWRSTPTWQTRRAPTP